MTLPATHVTTMQPDLFTKHNPQEQSYAQAIATLVHQEEQDRISNGIIAPWVEADYILAKDERRLLELIDTGRGYIMRDGDYVIVPYGDTGARRVTRFTCDMDMNADANSKAVLNAAIERGLVTVTRDNAAGGNRIDMAQLGRYYLEICDTDKYWEEMEDD